ncbi:MAG: 4Fe-4S binding protein, partial [Candidatus Cyclobacteriaceae bacterium M3_2C_046]
MSQSMMQKTGMGLFIAATFFLMAILFLNNYQLEKQVVRDVLNEEQLEFGEEALEPMFGKLYTSKFQFINDFEDHLGQANRNIQEKYGISDQEIQQIIKASQEGEQVNYNLDRLKELYNQDDEVEAYKAEQLSGYTNWLVDKEFSSINELEQALSQSISNLNRNIIQQRGFSDYLINQIKLDATKKSGVGFVSDHHLLLFWLIIGAGLIGGLLYILPKLNLLPGIKNNHVFHSANKNRGWIGISIGILLILFYVVIYWYPAFVTEWLILVDPLSYWIKNQPASQWFFYGFLYTLAIAVMGIRMIIHYRHSKYHI